MEYGIEQQNINAENIMKTLILAGGGHGHINILKEMIKKPLDGVRTFLISDNRRQYYSGMLPGFIEGKYSEDEISFDVPKLCKKAGAQFIEERIIRIDKENNLVITENGEYGYDFLSLNLGGISKKYPSEDGYREYHNLTYTKPISALIDFIRKIDFKNTGNGKSLAVIGGGASSVETSIALKVAFPFLNIEIFSKSDELIRNFNSKSKEEVRKILDSFEIKVNTGYEFLYYKNNIAAFFKEKEKLFVPMDFVIISSGISGIAADFKGIDTIENNFIRTDKYLRVNENILAMGDMIEFNDMNLPKAGVFAIHEAPVLFKNLIKMISGDNDLIEYKPNQKYLQIINTGYGTGLLNWGNITLTGRIPFIIKDYIDRNYMRTE